MTHGKETTGVSRRRFLAYTSAGVGVVAVPTLLAACGSDSEPAASKSALTDMTMQSAWINDAEFLGYFAALELGFYEREGINLTYLSGGPDVMPEAQVLGGKAQLALTTPDMTCKSIADEGAPFKIIATQYQKNPIGVVSLVESNINGPADLVGKTLACPPANLLSIKAMFSINGINENDVKVVPYQYDPTPLITGEVDATIDFTTNVPYTIGERGKTASSFLLYDVGFITYNDTVVVTEEYLKSNRDEIVGWLRASRDGWEENFWNINGWPERVADTWFAGTGRTIANEVFFNNAQKALMEHPDGIFAMDEEGIQGNIETLNRHLDIKATRDMFVTDLLDEV